MTLSRRVLLLAVPALLAGCAAPPRSGDGALLRDLSRPGSALDQGLAAEVISQYRRNNGLAPVAPDPRLAAVAQEMASAMARADDVSASLRQPPLRERLARRGVTAGAAEENVSAGYRTLGEAFSMWRGSRPHDRVLRLPAARRIGIAAVQAPGSRFAVYWALVMAEGG
jgi:uncharacterized protein YkwD